MEIASNKISKSIQSKINRKQKRCQSIISKETGIQSSQFPTRFLAVCNAGLSTGLREEDLLQEALNYGQIDEVILIPKKSYCFIHCSNVESAENIFQSLHAKCKLGQNEGVLYLSYFENIPKIENPWNTPNPSGLIVLKEFITEDEERLLLDAVRRNEDIPFESNDNETKVDNTLKHRKVKHFGYEFLYGSNQVDPNRPLIREIPEQCKFLWPRLKQELPNLSWHEPDQLTVNEYGPGQGIPPHVDTHSAFLDPILSLSLEGDTVIQFKRNERNVSVFLPRRSLLIMTEESRYDWTHGIIPRHIDFIPSKSGGLTAQRRCNRTSLTFRRLRRESCNCSYPLHCDSSKIKTDNLPKLEGVAEKLESENVHDVYEKIASHFSETRHTPWPKVMEFLKSFEFSSIILDIGCGNGKYLKGNGNIVKIGCDRSEGLLKLCCTNNFNVFKCDCLSVPFRDNSIDGCLSIAVIHHLATKERRLQAIQEMARILIVGGRALIYVWSKDQQADEKKSSYLRQNKKNNKGTKDLLEMNEIQMNVSKMDINLPIHMNRTEFQQQDVFVPWKLKSKSNENENSTYLRYYHVFEKGELESVCQKVDNIKIIQSYYDQGNWCLIFQKL